MRITTAWIGSIALTCLLTTGCYNNPHTSERKPGDGPQNFHSRPAVGPGTTAGGSTAGPQPAAKEEPSGHEQPTPGGAVAAEPGLGHATPAEPKGGHADAHTPAGPASRTGNEKGVGDRGDGAQKH